MAKMLPTAKPSRCVHDLCPYWLISNDGFRADAHVLTPKDMPRALAASLKLFTVGINPSTAAVNSGTLSYRETV